MGQREGEMKTTFLSFNSFKVKAKDRRRNGRNERSARIRKERGDEREEKIREQRQGAER